MLECRVHVTEIKMTDTGARVTAREMGGSYLLVWFDVESEEVKEWPIARSFSITFGKELKYA
jgi:hypothetical protein